jgi:hypothetical protein
MSSIGARIAPRMDADQTVFRLLAESFAETFPQLEGVRFSYGWGGPIAVTVGQLPSFGTLADGRVHYDSAGSSTSSRRWFAPQPRDTSDIVVDDIVALPGTGRGALQHETRHVGHRQRSALLERSPAQIVQLSIAGERAMRKHAIGAEKARIESHWRLPRRNRAADVFQGVDRRTQSLRAISALERGPHRPIAGMEIRMTQQETGFFVCLADCCAHQRKPARVVLVSFERFGAQMELVLGADPAAREDVETWHEARRCGSAPDEDLDRASFEAQQNQACGIARYRNADALRLDFIGWHAANEYRFSQRRRRALTFLPSS